MLQERKYGAPGVEESDAEPAGEVQEFTPQARYSAAGPIPAVQTETAQPALSASDLAYGAPHVGGVSTKPQGQTSRRGREHRRRDARRSGARGDAARTVSCDANWFIDQRAVTVRNPDKAAHTLDPTRPLFADPFHEFAAREKESLVLPPGESRDVTIEFKPTRRTLSEQSFQVSTDKGLGPQARLTVAGEGVEVSGNTEEEREAVEKARIADQDFQSEQIDARRVDDPNRAKRVAAERAVSEWKVRAVEYNQSLADWASANFERFLGKTGGDVHVAEPGRIAKFVKSKALKLAGMVAVPEEVEAHVAKHAIGKLGLNLYEKGVEKITDWLWEELTDEKKAPTPEESALQATEHMADQSIAKGRDISRAREAANLVVADSESAARMQIASASDAADLDGTRSWAQSEQASIPKKLDPKDMSLSEELLATWVRERAATPKKANDETNSTAWNKARAELAKSGEHGAPATLPTLETHDLFIHQCRNEWSRIGVDRGEIDQALAGLDAQLRGIEEEAARGGIADPVTVANTIKDRLGDLANPIVATFRRAQDPKAMAAAFAPQQRNFDDVWSDEFSKQFTLTCGLWLETSGNGVYVKEFTYHDTRTGDYRRKP